MNCRFCVPPPPLSDFVALLWLYEGNVLPHPKERLLPTGTVELVIDLRPSSRGSGVVCGAYSEYFELDTSEEAHVIGVHFKPGGAFPFLAPPVGELHNLHVMLEDLWGGEAADLRDRLLDATAAEARFRILADALLARTVKPLARKRAIAAAVRALDAPGARPVGDVVEETGMSQRRFIELFRAEVGLTPKLFSRVRRFQQVVRTAHAADDVDWSRIALACGYYDQAHFIHDFRAFSGMTPTAYLAGRTAHMNHVPVEA